jgi:hypothetical protein
MADMSAMGTSFRLFDIRHTGEEGGKLQRIFTTKGHPARFTKMESDVRGH